jgi:hypothetical protein
MALLHPESDLSMSEVAMGASLMKILSKKKKTIIVDELMEAFIKSDKRRSQENFFSTLCFLYMIGAVEKNDYHVKLVTSPKYSSPQGELQFTG